MSFQSNINNINHELKKNFEVSEADTSNHMFVKFTLSKPVLESVNNELQMKVIVSTKNLNEINPIIEWSYSDDPIKEDNYIGFRTSISNISESIANVLDKKRMSKDYLSSLEAEMIKESVDVESIEVEDTFEVNDTDVKIHMSKYITHVNEKLGLLLEFNTFDYFDDNGNIVDPNMITGREPELGDRLEATFAISSDSHSGHLKPNDWLQLEQCLLKLPAIDDVFMNTSKQTVTIDFDTDHFVELV